jgi:hypothetical protein
VASKNMTEAERAEAEIRLQLAENAVAEADAILKKQVALEEAEAKATEGLLTDQSSRAAMRESSAIASYKENAHKEWGRQHVGWTKE